MAAYSVWLVQTGLMPKHPLGGIYYGAHDLGRGPVPLGLVVVKGEGHLALIDCGFNAPEDPSVLADLYGLSQAESSDVALRRWGFSPEDVDTVILTHAHWDHMGNLPAFPNATIYLQRAELDGWLAGLARPEQFGFLHGGVDVNDFHHLIERSIAGQVRLVEGALNGVLPGVDLIPAHDTHTYGSQIVVIDSGSSERPQKWVAPGDCIFSFANLEGLDGSGTYVPIGQAIGSQERVLDLFERVMSLLDRQAGHLVPVHDLAAYERFPSRSLEGGLGIAEVVLAHGELSRL